MTATDPHKSEHIYQPIQDAHPELLGMSGDFERVVEEGTIHVRIGSAIFGQRESFFTAIT